MRKILTVVGARPQFIKAAVVSTVFGATPRVRAIFTATLYPRAVLVGRATILCQRSPRAGIAGAASGYRFRPPKVLFSEDLP